MEVTRETDLNSISFICKPKQTPQNERVPLFLVLRNIKPTVNSATEQLDRGANITKPIKIYL